MGLTNKIATMLLAFYLTASSSLGGEKKEGSVNLGYNALETGYNTQTNRIRDRLWTNISILLEKGEIGYSGFNEAENLRSNSYLGRHLVTLGERGGKIKPAVLIRTNSDGIDEIMWGIRDTRLMEMLRGYGNIDVVIGDGSGHIQLFYGKPIGDSSVEVTQEGDFRQGQKPVFYTEIQGNKGFGGKLALFGRVEVPNLHINKSAFIGGITYRFKK